MEFKTSFSAEVIETLVAFANTQGGNVYVGLADDGSAAGVNLSPETVQQWINEINTKTSPMIIPDVEVRQVHGLQEYPIKPVSFQGK